MSIHRQVDPLVRRKAALLGALAHPLRVAVAEFLREGERCVCDIAAHVGGERSNTSRHLAIMLKAGVVRCRKDGLRVLYELRTPCIVNVLNCAARAAEESCAAAVA